MVGDMNVASEAIDIHPRIGTPEGVYGDEACQLLVALTRRHVLQSMPREPTCLHVWSGR